MIFEKIIEIIIIILKELSNNNQIDKLDIDRLSRLGYSQGEISTAFNWIYTRFSKGDKLFAEKLELKRSHRVLHEVERKIISSESYGYVIQLRELGLLNDYDVEVIIDKIMVSAFQKINLVDMKLFIGSYLLDLDEMTNTFKRISINIYDTVN